MPIRRPNKRLPTAPIKRPGIKLSFLISLLPYRPGSITVIEPLKNVSLMPTYLVDHAMRKLQKEFTGLRILLNR
jgi:hypothetical protein